MCYDKGSAPAGTHGWCVTTSRIAEDNSAGGLISEEHPDGTNEVERQRLAQRELQGAATGAMRLQPLGQLAALRRSGDRVDRQVLGPAGERDHVATAQGEVGMP